MLRWLNAFVSKPGQTIPGVDDEMFDNITVPTLIIRGGENDWDHPKRTSLEVSCLIKGSNLIEPPWPEDAWERAAADSAAGKVEGVPHVRHLGAGRARNPEVPGQVMRRHSQRSDVHLAVQRRFERRVDSAFRDAVEIGLRRVTWTMSRPSSPGVRVISPVRPKPASTPWASSSVPLLT